MNAKDFKKISSSVWMLDNDVDLVFSSSDFDNVGKGWYLQKGDTTSDLYLLDSEAIDAWKNKEDKNIFPVN